MHRLFRTLSQQVGMEAVRAILPEEIDRLLNQSIIGFVRSTLEKNANIQYRDRITIRENSIAPINALRTLYKVTTGVNIRVYIEDEKLNVYHVEVNSDEIMVVTNIAVSYINSDKTFYNCRFIEPEEYHQLRNDFCNSPSYNYPIVTMWNDDKRVMTFCFENGGKRHIPSQLQIGYIKHPNIVDITNNVNCDLPDHVHTDIVTNAAKVYLSAINLTTNKV